MYAAAGGASLASRQKRKNQAAQNVKNKALLQQGLKDKLAATRASNLAPSKAQSRPFHNLPSTYLRAPQAHLPVRKLSAGYTTQSKILVPINESNNQYFSHFHPHATPLHHPHHLHHHHDHDHDHSTPTHDHHHHHQHLHHHDPQLHHFRAATPRPSVVHDPSIHVHHRLTKSATASIPLVSHLSDITPPDSPSCLLKPPQTPLPTQQSHVTFGVGTAECHDSTVAAAQQAQSNVPYFVIPATPATSPGPPNTEQLERKCSIFRGKQFEFDDTFHEADYADEYHVKHAIKPHHTTTAVATATVVSAVPVVERWTDSECCDSDHQNSVCTCDHTEVK